MIREDQFREDLYFRINTFEVRLPSLRERQGDIPDLARHLLARAARRPVEQVAGLLTPEVLQVLQAHDWSGNVRELYNVMEHAAIFSGGAPVLPEHLPALARRQMPTSSVAAGPDARSAPAIPFVSGAPRTLDEIEMEHLLRVLEKHNGSKTAAAAELGISLKTMYNKLNRLEKDRKAAG